MNLKHLAAVAVFSIVSVSAATPEKVELALNWKPEPEFGGFYAAQLAKLDRENGIELDIKTGGAGQPVVQMVASGQVEFGIASGDEVLIARERGADVVALFSVYQTSPVGFMVHASRGFKKLEDVFKNPGTVSLQKGLPQAAFLEKKYGFSKVKIVPYAGGIAAFLHDKDFSQQCFVTSEPIAARREKANPQTFLVSESGFDPYVEVVITRGEVLKKKPELVKKLMKVFRAGWAKYLADPKATNEMMYKLNPSLDLATYAESAEVQKPLIETALTRKQGLGAMTLEHWKKMADQLLELKLLTKKADVKSAFMTKD